MPLAIAIENSLDWQPQLLVLQLWLAAIIMMVLGIIEVLAKWLEASLVAGLCMRLWLAFGDLQ
jgi:hypothetical protein